MTDLDDPSSPLAVLRAAGITDPAALVGRLAASWPGGTPPAAVLTALAAAPDPALAVASLGRLRDAVPEAVEATAADETRGAALVALLGASNMMVRWLVAEPTRWPTVLGTEDSRTPIAVLEPRPEPPVDASPEDTGASAACTSSAGACS